MALAFASASPSPVRDRLRLVTYNVHGCVGTDRTLSEERIAEVLAELDPDVAALQELDVGRERSSRGHQPEKLAKLLSMSFLFCPAVRDGDEHYGHAVLSKFPLSHVKSKELPSSNWPRPREPRSALWAQIDTPRGPVQIISTHLGLSPLERGTQVNALRSDIWMNHPDFKGPRIFCGDLNAGPFSYTYLRLKGVLRDAHRAIRGFRARPTFPARRPFLRLDHVFASRDLEVIDARVVTDLRARTASDHLPLVVELALPAPEKDE